MLFVSFRARCLASSAETGGGHLFVTLQQAKTYESLSSLTAAPGKTWTRFCLRAVAERDYPASGLELVLPLGSYEQTLDVAGFVAVNLGPDIDLRKLPFTRVSYEGQAPDAPWRQKALARIEDLRKGDLSVMVLGADGKTITRTVRVTRNG